MGTSDGRHWQPISQKQAIHEMNLPEPLYQTIVATSLSNKFAAVFRSGHKPNVQRRVNENCVAKPQWAKLFTTSPTTGLLDLATVKPESAKDGKEWSEVARKKLVYDHDAAIVEEEHGKLLARRWNDFGVKVYEKEMSGEAYRGMLVDCKTGMPFTSDTDAGAFIFPKGERSSLNLFPVPNVEDAEKVNNTVAKQEVDISNPIQRFATHAINDGISSIKVNNPWTGVPDEPCRARMPHGPNVGNPSGKRLPNIGSEELIAIFNNQAFKCMVHDGNEAAAYEELKTAVSPIMEVAEDQRKPVTVLYGPDRKQVWRKGQPSTVLASEPSDSGNSDGDLSDSDPGE